MRFTNASASVIGSTHYKLNYNNQDSYGFYQDDTCIVGVVADGCGSGSNSEVGSRLCTDFVVNFCKKHFSNHAFDAELLQTAVLEYLRNLVKNQQTSDEQDFIENYLLFTLFGFVIQPKHTFVFHSGDGIYLINDKVMIIEQDNRPRYIAKNLIGGNAQIEVEQIATHELHRLLIATDGLMHLHEKFVHGDVVAGMTSIGDLFEADAHFSNMVSLPKAFTDLSINKNVLKDDTTLIMLKRD